jgi:hypothetical protein
VLPLIDHATIALATANVARWGDTDVFPFPVENHVFHDQAPGVRQLVEDIAANFDDRIVSNPVYSYSTLAPVGYTGFRWATQIDPLWNAYFLALVLSLADQIESARIPVHSNVVYSYRYQPDSEGGSLFRQQGWKDFQDRSRNLAQTHPYVVALDIADFYSRIYHHRLENALRNVDPGATKTATKTGLRPRLGQCQHVAPARGREHGVRHGRSLPATADNPPCLCLCRTHVHEFHPRSHIWLEEFRSALKGMSTWL